jgi:amidase
MPPAALFRPVDHQLAYTFATPLHDPLGVITPGTAVQVWTEDCFAGAVHDVQDLPSQVCRMPFLNPVTGPFHIDGAEPGDTLAVHLINLTPARDYGFSSTFPHFGGLTSTAATATLQPPLPERVWRYRIDADTGTVFYQARISGHVVQLPLEPMIGTIGVAPAGGEARSTLTAGQWGGNLDTPMIRAGTTVYLPVNVPGAMLALGDGHARQGAGELCGVAVEVPMHITLVVDVIKGVPTRWPRVETDTTLASLGCARPLEDAVRIAGCDLVGWVVDLTDLDQLDAYQLVSQAGDVVVGNVVNPAYTMLATIAKQYVPGAVAYGGVHARLRDLATAGRR